MDNSQWIYILLFLLIIHPKTQAQTCCSGGVPLSNNIGGLPISSKNTLQFSLNSDLNVLKTLKNGTTELDDNSRERKTVSILFKSTYSFTDKFFAEGLFSWVQQERLINQPAGYTDYDKTQGVGDAVLLFNYVYLSSNRLKLVMGAGPKAPTGSSNLRGDDGITLNADLQPGSGAWDGIMLHRIQLTSKKRPSQTYFSNFTFRYTGTNNNYLGNEAYRFGNEFQILSGIADQFLIGSTIFSLGVNARYRLAKQDKLNDEMLPSTGGKWLFVMPAVGWHIKQNLIISLITEVPLYAYVEGTQLSPTFRINGGVYYSFSKKSSRSEQFK